MKFKIALAFFIFSAAVELFANVGIFTGGGETPLPGKSVDIQMVEELVEMYPEPGKYPVDLSCRNLDKMYFYCTFKLRNLSNKSIAVPVGFPVSDGSMVTPLDTDVLVKKFKFSASVNGKEYKVRYIPYDKHKTFSDIFMWEMDFLPGEEKVLRVKYCVSGYFGMVMAEKKTGDMVNEAFLPYRKQYLHYLSLGIGQMQQYVTGTASSWAGKVEKATFRYYHTDFEKYLSQRGAWHESKSERKKRLNGLKTAEEIWNPQMPMLYRWTPERSRWRDTKNAQGIPCLELNYSPFTPDIKSKIEISYFFIAMPRNVEEFDAIHRIIKKDIDTTYASSLRLQKYKPDVYAKHIKYWSRVQPYSSRVKKQIADVVLEFYGIKRNNAEIRDFLINQFWYPQKNPPQITEDFKKYLLEISGE